MQTRRLLFYNKAFTSDPAPRSGPIGHWSKRSSRRPRRAETAVRDHVEASASLVLARFPESDDGGRGASECQDNGRLLSEGDAMATPIGSRSIFGRTRVTLPSAEMRAVMAAARVGDDFYGEDPTVTRARGGGGAGHWARRPRSYVPSGTMGNLLAHLTHCPGGAEVIGPEPAHSFANETGGPSRVAGMTVRAVPQRAGELDLGRIRALIRRPGGGVLTQPTGLLWVEQPTRGHVVPVDQLARAPHDGGRLRPARSTWTARGSSMPPRALGVPAASIAAAADSVMFCVSKGLAAPVGSLLVGAGSVHRPRRRPSPDARRRHAPGGDHRSSRPVRAPP